MSIIADHKQPNGSPKGRILFISNFSGATFTFIADRELIMGLNIAGYKMFTIAGSPRGETIQMEEKGINVSYLPAGNKNDKGVIADLRELIVVNKIDIVHVTYSKALKNILAATKGLPVKIVTFYGSFGLHWHDPSAWFSFLHPRISKIICVSDAVEKHVKRQLPNRRDGRTVRIYRGYQPSWFSGITPIDRKTLGVGTDEFLVCSIAFVRRIKGIDFLVEASNFIPDGIPVKIMLVGDGTDSAAMRKRVKSTIKPDRFVLIGHASVSPSYTAACDLYVQPSVSEGLGRAIIEAMCMEKPVIATNGGGLVELFREGDNGFVVPHSNAKAIADMIVHCYRNRDSLKVVGTKARATIEKSFNLSDTVNQTIAVYNELLQS